MEDANLKMAQQEMNTKYLRPKFLSLNKYKSRKFPNQQAVVSHFRVVQNFMQVTKQQQQS